MDSKLIFITANNANVLNDNQLVGLGITDVEFGLEIKLDGSGIAFGRSNFFC
jgi:hypothetical protein